ncbi:MAG: kelch repeat-containing protein [Terracidiphilus sp.]
MAAKRTLKAAGMLAALLIACLPKATQAQATSWGWMSGANTTNANDSATVPGSRYGASSWTDLNGNFWFFGGLGNDATGNLGYLNDLWEYSSGTWALKSSNATIAVPGASLCNESNYTVGTYVVGGRSGAPAWVDASGNLWLFGGFGCGNANTSPGYLNDLWMYNIASGQWTSEGAGTANQAGSYGPQYVSSTSFFPGTRYSVAAWTGSDGSFWLFGGFGIDSGGNTGSLNDLWKFNPTSKEWTWMAGSLTRNQKGTYGTEGEASDSNTPGGRTLSTGVVDSSGNLLLFGGDGLDSSGNSGDLNDLWKFNTTTLQWTWISGSNTASAPGSYGTLFTTAAGNFPGAREGSNLWLDKAGNLWLFGGGGDDTNDDQGYLNDLWEFDVTSEEWTWTGGTKTIAAAETPVYGTEGTPAITNIPGAHYTYAAWNDSQDDFWLFGGFGFSTSVGSGDLNDLWEAIPPTPTPAFSLAAGTYQGSQTLTITDAINGAVIYYTTDGTIPTTSSPTYTGAITLNKTSTVQAIAVAAGRSQSLIRFAEYIVTAQTAITWEPPAPITYGTPLSSVELNATTSIPGDFVYTPAAGSILPVGNNTLSVTFTPTDTSSFQAATATVTLQVSPSTPVITWATPSPIAYGTALSATQLDASASFNGNPVPGTSVYLPAAGTVPSAGTQTLAVTFTPTGPGAANYTTATASVTIEVGQNTPTITWAKPAAITYGTALGATQLNATATYGGTTVPGTFLYFPAAGSVLPVGTQTLNLVFTPNDTNDYAVVQASTTLVVTQATPIVTWQSPAAIYFGTALSAAQLDATASVPGTFVYLPAAGAVPSTGTQTLSVTFTPSDTIDYAAVQQGVTLTVLPPGFTISGSPTGQTVYAGYSTDFVITVAPLGGTFNNAVTLSVAGLPSGATGTFSQPTLTPGASAASAILTVAVPSTTTLNQRPASPFQNAPRTLAPLMALLLLLPFRKARKASRKISLLLVLAASLGVMLSMSACGTPGAKTINFQDEFVLTVTGASGGNTQNAQLVLTVE